MAALAFLAAAPGALWAQAPAASASPAPSVSPSPSPTPDSLAELSAALLADETRRGEIEAAMNDAEAPAALKSRAEALCKQIDEPLAADAKALSSGPSLDTVEAMGQAWRGRGTALAAFLKSLTERIGEGEARIKALDELQKKWKQKADEAKTPQELQLVPRMKSLAAAAKKNRDDAQKRLGELAPLLPAAQKQAREVERLLARIDEAGPQAFGRLFLTESVPIWSGTLWNRTLWENTGFSLGTQTRAAWDRQTQAVAAYARGKEETFLKYGFLFVVLLGLFFWMRRRVRDWTSDDPSLSRAAQVFEAPVSMAVVFALLASPGIFPPPPPLVTALGGAVALIPAVVLLRRLLDRHFFPVLNAMVVFYFVDQVRRVAVALPIAARFLFLAEMGGGAVFAAWLLWSRSLRGLRGQNPGLAKMIGGGAVAALAFFGAAFVSNAVGCVDLGNLLGNPAFQSACLAVVFFAATRVASGLIAGALSVQPLAGLRAVRHNRTLLWKRIHWGVDAAALLIWVVQTINLLPGARFFWDKAEDFFYVVGADGKGSLTLLGQVATFGAVVWGAFLLSRFIRFVLEEDVYPRARVERGLSYAVSTMTHYALLLVGFYMAAALAGIDMTKFNILIGAFGVGMGLGLQNIISNFVSGVILLFERPVKVGDVVQMSDVSGTVDRIGIRASIIRTGAGSEIIVPNGKLIADQVTNWTLSNRLRGIELPVSVAEGPDPCRVIELLKAAAAAHPLVCKQPAPNALLMELGTDLLQFKLTAWTDQYDQWGQIRSDLAIAVHAALAREGIRRSAAAAAPAAVPSAAPAA